MVRYAVGSLVAVLALAVVAVGDEPAPSAGKMTSQDLARWIDERFAQEYKQAGITAAPVVDDATFLRRIYLDLQGRVPTVAQTRDFLADEGSFKRADYVDRLLSDESRPQRFAQRSASHLARVWRRMLVPSSAPGAGLAVRLDPWLAKQFADNTPYDQFARKLLLASPQVPQLSPGTAPPPPTAPNSDAVAAIFQQAVGGSPENLTSAYVRVFLGVRLNCAQCHDHPFTDWKRSDFWGVAALFAGGFERAADARPAPIISPPDAANLSYTAKLLWTDDKLTQIPADTSPRELLADWMVAPENPNFAPTAVNRVWQYLCGRGLAGSVDDLDQAPEEERRVLDDLARLFVESGYDVRWLVTGICKSQVYQQSIREHADEADGIARRPLKTLLPEQVFDSLEQALGLPIARADNGPRFNGEREQFVARMNESAAESPADYKAGIPQALMMMNGRLAADATSMETSRTLRAVVDAPFLRPEEKLETLYLAAFTRKPSSEETKFLLHHIEQQKDEASRRQAYAEILWGLLNSPEFVLSR